MKNKFLKSYLISIILAIALVISLFFNFKPKIPLFSFSVNYPVENGSNLITAYIFDSEKHPNEVLETFNILTALEEANSDVKIDFEKPDLVLMRNVPSQGYCDMVCNFYFRDDIAFFWVGNIDSIQPNEKIYQLDSWASKRIKEITKYNSDYYLSTEIPLKE